ncbi:hypothetical protein ABPG74_020043 [Tetrahymena malaccensis]
MDSKAIKIIQEFDSHLKKRNEIKQMLRNKNVSMLDLPDQAETYLKINIKTNSQDEKSMVQQIQILMQQGQASNSNQINQLNQTIIQYKLQIQSLEGQVKQLHQELSKCQNENQKIASYSNQIDQLNQTLNQQKQQIQSLNGQVNQLNQKLSEQQKENQQMSQNNISLKEKISSLEAKLQEVVQKPQQNYSQMFQPQQAQMQIKQQIQQVQPQQVVNAFKPVVDRQEMDSKAIKIIQEFDSHLKKRNEIKQMLRNKNVSMLDLPDQTETYLKINIKTNSQDEKSMVQQIQILMQQGQASNSNQLNQLNQTIIQYKQQIQSLEGQVKQLHQELSKCQNENQKISSYSNQIDQLNQTLNQQKQQIQSLNGQVNQLNQKLSEQQKENQQMSQNNIQLKEQISSLEVKLHEVVQKPQQNYSLMFQPQQAQMQINQQIQQVVNAFNPDEKKQTPCIEALFKLLFILKFLCFAYNKY